MHCRCPEKKAGNQVSRIFRSSATLLGRPEPERDQRTTMRARQARWTNLNDPVEWDKKIPNANRPNFFDSNAWTVTYDRPQVKTECAGTDGRTMGSPPGNTMTTPRRAPATPAASTELSARAVTFAPSAHNVGQAAKRAYRWS